MPTNTRDAPCLKGNLLFHDKDALLAIALLARMQADALLEGKTHKITVADMMREAVRCLAKERGVTA